MQCVALCTTFARRAIYSRKLAASWAAAEPMIYARVRRRMVYGLLEKEFKEGLHALNINAKTPAEIAKAAAK